MTRLTGDHGVSFVVVTYNSASTIQRCLKSILKQEMLPSEIIVVDNHSQDGTLSLVSETCPDAVTIRNQENEGYGIANNVGISEAKNELVAVLNPDVRLESEWSKEIRAGLESDRLCGAAEGKLLLERDPRIVNSRGSEINLLGFGCATGYGQRDPGMDVAKCVSYPSGAAFMIRRGVFGEVGGFDPTYFLYHEDVDLGLRIYSHGWRVLYIPTARAYHDLNADWRPSKLLLLEKNRWKTLLKNMPLGYFARSGLLLLLSEAGILGYLAGSNLWRAKGRADFELLKELPSIAARRWLSHEPTLSLARLSDIVSDEFPAMLPKDSLLARIGAKIQHGYLEAFFGPFRHESDGSEFLEAKAT